MLPLRRGTRDLFNNPAGKTGLYDKSPKEGVIMSQTRILSMTGTTGEQRRKGVDVYL